MIKEALAGLLQGRDLPRDVAQEVMEEIMAGGATPGQIGGFLVALRMKGETAEEIAGCAQAMRAHAVAVNASRQNLIDTAGTGGDGAGTLNLSTAAALVAAASGAGVAKHGNRAISSQCGSADVLEALGFTLDLDPPTIARSIDELGFGFLFAPAHHPAMRHAAPVRRELAVRTVFNILGPLTNPAGATAQLIGVFAPELVPLIAKVLTLLGTERALVVHGAGGIDELSPAGPNLVHEVVDGTIRESVVDPIEFGVAPCRPADLSGGTPEENAVTIRAVFEGERGPKRDAILLNAAAALFVAGSVTDLSEGYAIAAQVVDGGGALARLQALAEFTRDAAEQATAATQGAARAS
jgi:anthranilate phosphoribosyltransferase